MPVAYVDLPSGLPAHSKKQLVSQLYEAIHHTYPIDDTRVLLREFSLEDVSQDGRLDSESMRPVVRLEVPPGVPIEAKRQLVGQISSALETALRLQKDEVRLPSGKKLATNWVLTFFRESQLDQVALDGLMASENPMVLEGMELARRR